MSNSIVLAKKTDTCVFVCIRCCECGHEWDEEYSRHRLNGARKRALREECPECEGQRAFDAWQAEQ